MERTLTIKLERDASASLDAMRDAVKAAFKKGTYQGEYRVYSTPEQLFRVFTPARWNVLDELQKHDSPIGVRPLAGLLDRDPTAVLRDLKALAEEGIVEQDARGKWMCPFSVIHTDFTLEHAPRRKRQLRKLTLDPGMLQDLLKQRRIWRLTAKLGMKKATLRLRTLRS